MTGLISGDFVESSDPFALFADWFAEAKAAEPNDPNAMALATVDATGLPDVRVVLLKQADERGFVFYTNEESAKGGELASTPKAALVLHWKSIRRQVRVRGAVVRVTDAEADAYFASRSRDSRIAAAASDQSRPLDSRKTFDARVAELQKQFEGKDVPRPAHWGGYRIVPSEIEFWQDRAHRMHDRVRFTRKDTNSQWTKARLYP
ncbi:MAG: pyridoxamine 5'-phosphate oxidase [Rhizobiales bacterium]|jgi:pyridoxamine 5'-phosphate oxidase|nr:pyridoxamine 5'-phosphate oxidase [Hyphomicrobiales bacterium]